MDKETKSEWKDARLKSLYDLLSHKCNINGKTIIKTYLGDANLARVMLEIIKEDRKKVDD